MSPTKKLYDNDSYLCDFEAEVLACEKINTTAKADCYAIILDQSAFFPNQGGQSSDKGFIWSIKTTDEKHRYAICDVQIDEEGVITHLCTQPFQTGEHICGCIDWHHRFSNMQQHTGEHIFSGLVYKYFGYHNVGFHLSKDIITMDYDGFLSTEDLTGLELECNHVIIKNIEVKAFYPDSDKLSEYSYRSKKEMQPPIRLVIINGVDICACCAPHVHSTGEIGLFKIIDAQKYKSGTRLSILCGYRALLDYHTKQQSVIKISNLLSVPQSSVTSAVSNLKEELKKAKDSFIENEKKLLSLELSLIDEIDENVCLITQTHDAVAIRNALNELVLTHAGYCGIFWCTSENEYQFILASRFEDCIQQICAMRIHFDIKGGGKPEMVQGQMHATQESIQQYFKNNLQ